MRNVKRRLQWVLAISMLSASVVQAGATVPVQGTVAGKPSHTDVTNLESLESVQVIFITKGYHSKNR
jgi:hypothetical protein